MKDDLVEKYLMDTNGSIKLRLLCYNIYNVIGGFVT